MKNLACVTTIIVIIIRVSSAALFFDELCQRRRTTHRSVVFGLGNYPCGKKSESPAKLFYRLISCWQCPDQYGWFLFPFKLCTHVFVNSDSAMAFNPEIIIALNDVISSSLLAYAAVIRL